ncbi:MAG: putative metal-binding motif-containing protein, partial [Sandaracinaceae bacterium]|nr:putative metal-binding motif-containing protein [Sandaracinaceae bacterium]
MALSALLCGCSVVVGAPPVSPVPCEILGTDPCPPPLACFAGFCQVPPDGGFPCQEQEVGCNGRDDNCDGTIDEGSDFDSDGFTWCDSDIALRDCRDDNAGVHPGGRGIPAPEDVPCDGADNDCNGVITECAVGEVCAPGGSCARPDCTFPGFACPEGRACNTALIPPVCEITAVDCVARPGKCSPPMVCDPISRGCIMPLALGAPCSDDGQCSSGLCVEVAALGLASGAVAGAARICSAACCSDNDCAADAACWVPGTGARGCVPRALLDQSTYGAPDVRACTSPSQCGGEHCALDYDDAYETQDRETYFCRPPFSSSDPLLGVCDFGNDCRSGLCIRYCPFLCYTQCSNACGSSRDCGGGRCGWLDSEGQFIQTC